MFEMQSYSKSACKIFSINVDQTVFAHHECEMKLRAKGPTHTHLHNRPTKAETTKISMRRKQK